MGAPTRQRWLRQRRRPAVIAIVIVALVLVSLIAGFFVGERLEVGRWVEPAQTVQGYIHDTRHFTSTHVMAMAVIFVVLGALTLGAWLITRTRTSSSSWVDGAAEYMATPKELRGSLSRRAVTKKAKKLGVKGL